MRNPVNHGSVSGFQVGCGTGLLGVECPVAAEVVEYLKSEEYGLRFGFHDVMLRNGSLGLFDQDYIRISNQG